MKETDPATFSPFVLITGDFDSLILSDEYMLLRTAVFEEKSDQGWIGNGHDWASIARLIMREQLPDLEGSVDLDPEAGLFSAVGPVEGLMRLGERLKQAFDDPDLLRSYIARAELE